MDEFTYARAGVSIDAEDDVVRTILQGVGFSQDRVECNGMQMVLCTDGVGSKVLVANEMKKWDTIGIDCIAMNVNDALVMGARPLAFVDYLAMERMDVNLAREIAKGLKRGAEEAGIIITGGETATLPEVVRGFDLAGTCLGMVEQELPHDIRPGDVIIGVESSGIHSNGYTLARKVFTENGYSFHDEMEELGVIGTALLEPTRIYVKGVLDLWQHVDVKGIAHITGSGLRKLARVSLDVCFTIEEPLPPQPIFHIIQKLGNVSDEEMYRTFNMGMGMAIIVAKEDVDDTLTILTRHHAARVVGHVREGSGVDVPPLDIHI